MKKIVFLSLLAMLSLSSMAQTLGRVKQEGGYTNVRKGPGTNYEILTKIKDGSSIYYEYYNKSWYGVYDENMAFIGYMHSSKIIPSASAQNVPSIPKKNQRTTSASTTPYDWLAREYATYEKIAGYDKGQLRVLRNSIYARHGRIFKDAALRDYFNSQPWYNGWRNEVPADELNKFEKYNIQFILKYE